MGTSRKFPGAATSAIQAMKHFPDPATFAQGIAERRPQGVGDEAERVEEIALARAVRTDEERERRRRDVARGDALVVAQHDAGRQSAVHSDATPRLHDGGGDRSSRRIGEAAVAELVPPSTFMSGGKSVGSFSRIRRCVRVSRGKSQKNQ